MTEITLDESKLKELLKVAIVEVFQEQKELFSDLLVEVIEEIALEKGIREGETTEAVNPEAISSRQPIVINYEGQESIAIIPTAELESLMETVYLFQSHETAKRLLDALERAKARTNKPRTVEDLRQEFGLGEKEEKASA
jgi:antitoxin YefM